MMQAQPKLVSIVFRRTGVDGASMGHITRIIAKDAREGRKILREMMDQWEMADKAVEV